MKHIISHHRNNSKFVWELDNVPYKFYRNFSFESTFPLYRKTKTRLSYTLINHKTPIIQGTSQNSRQTHVDGGKRGKTFACVRVTVLVLLHPNSDETGVGDFKTISLAYMYDIKPKQEQSAFNAQENTLYIRDLKLVITSLSIVSRLQ